MILWEAFASSQYRDCRGFFASVFQRSCVPFLSRFGFNVICAHFVRCLVFWCWDYELYNTLCCILRISNYWENFLLFRLVMTISFFRWPRLDYSQNTPHAPPAEVDIPAVDLSREREKLEARQDSLVLGKCVGEESDGSCVSWIGSSVWLICSSFWCLNNCLSSRLLGWVSRERLKPSDCFIGSRCLTMNACPWTVGAKCRDTLDKARSPNGSQPCRRVCSCRRMHYIHVPTWKWNRALTTGRRRKNSLQHYLIQLRSAKCCTHE